MWCVGGHTEVSPECGSCCHEFPYSVSPRELFFQCAHNSAPVQCIQLHSSDIHATYFSIRSYTYIVGQWAGLCAFVRAVSVKC